MKNKNELREQLNMDMAFFLAQGKQITKVASHGKQRFAKPKEEQEYVEIEVEHLPAALQKKFFGEEK